MKRRLVRLSVWTLVLASVTVGAQISDAEREKWEPLSLLLDALGLEPGSAVADIGAGDGYHTERLARVVGPGGHVVAVEIEPRALERLKARVDTARLSNVQIVQGLPDDPRLQQNSLDAVLIFNAYHEMPAYAPMLLRIRQALKQGGRLVIVEPVHDRNRGLGREAQVAQHEIAPELVLSELKTAGFDVATEAQMYMAFTSQTDPGGYWLVRGIR